MAAGRIRTDLSAIDVTGLLTVTLMSAAQMSLLDVELTESPLDPEQLWAWCAAAVGAEPPAPPARPVAAEGVEARRPAARRGQGPRQAEVQAEVGAGAAGLAPPS